MSIPMPIPTNPFAGFGQWIKEHAPGGPPARDPDAVAQRLAQASRTSPGIAQFLTSGTFAGISQGDQRAILDLLRGTPWDDAPGQFFVDWHRVNQNQAQDRRVEEYDPYREVHGGLPGATIAPPANPLLGGNSPAGTFANSPGAPAYATPGVDPLSPGFVARQAQVASGGGSAGGGSSSGGGTPDFGGVIDEFGRPAGANYVNTVAQDQARVRAQQAQNGGGTGGGTTSPGAFGGAGFVNQGNPEQATRQYMLAHDMDPDSNGFFGDFINKLMGNLVPTLMSLTLDANGKPAMDQLANLNGLLDPILFGGAGTMGANLQGFADKAQGGLQAALPGLEAPQQATLLRNLTALRTMPMNPYLATATNNRLDTAINKAQDYSFGLAQQGKTVPHEWNLGDWIRTQLPPGYVNPLPPLR